MCECEKAEGDPQIEEKMLIECGAVQGGVAGQVPEGRCGASLRVHVLIVDALLGSDFELLHFEDRLGKWLAFFFEKFHVEFYPFEDETFCLFSGVCGCENCGKVGDVCSPTSIFFLFEDCVIGDGHLLSPSCF
jgi:hypothetical protein